MSGPYPSSGYPQHQPGPGNWPGGQPANGPSGGSANGPGGYGQPTYAIHNMDPHDNPYGGLGTGNQPGGNGSWGGGDWGGGDWGGGEPPRRPRSVARIVVAVVAILVIIGGVAASVLILTHRHSQSSASGGSNPPTAQTTQPASSSGAPVSEGSTTLTLVPGNCVTATVVNNQYVLGKQVACGGPDSDLLVARTAASLGDCASHQYLLIQAPSEVYCFTLDVKQGDCLDNNFLKVACGGSVPFAVLSLEAGPGTQSSCAGATGATRWVPASYNPAKVACIGPPKS